MPRLYNKKKKRFENAFYVFGVNDSSSSSSFMCRIHSKIKLNDNFNQNYKIIFPMKTYKTDTRYES